MEYLYKTFNLVKYEFPKQEIFWHTLMYSLIGFFTPFFMGHPQWLVGTMVNAMLVLAALNLKKYETLPVIMLPSMGVLAAGVIFGGFSIFLMYFIPFIWIGNALIVYFMKHFHVRKKLNYAFSIGLSSAIKAGFLFSAAFILVSLNIVPAMFLTAMGILQLGTAIGGGIVAYAAVKVRNYF